MVKRISFLVLFVVILGIFSQTSTAHTVEPIFIKLSVIQHKLLNYEDVTIEWIQMSDADQYCISKHTPDSRGYRLVWFGCFPSEQGLKQFSSEPFSDVEHTHKTGDMYFIEEKQLGKTIWKNTEGMKATSYRSYLPLFLKED